MDALLDAMDGAFRDAEQLDPETEFVSGGEIGERDQFDALDRDRRRVDLGAEGERSEDREFMRRVKTADVEGRIRFRIAEPLRLGQADLEGQAFGLHPRQNIVAGAVENARDALDRVSGQALAQGLDDRNAAADRRLVIERRLMRFGQAREPEPVRGEHRLVGGDHRQAARERSLDGLEGDPVRSADQFDKNVDIGGSGHFGGVSEERRPAEIDRAFASVARAIGGEQALAARSRDELRPPPLQ